MKAILPLAATEHYEALRRSAVTREPVFSAAPLGAILVVKHGVAAWMRRWGQVGGAPAAPTPSAPLPLPTAEPRWQRDLALLLAEMTAPHLRSTSS
jgi:hypothetical protein